MAAVLAQARRRAVNPLPQAPRARQTSSAVQQINEDEVRRYLQRVGDRWPIERALLGGARVADAHGAGPQRERGPEFVVVLVSGAFDGMPWLERVYHAGALWDASEMGAAADVHCYTPAEFERKSVTLPTVRDTVRWGIVLLAPAAA
jgi:uncharacterized protein